MHLCANLFPYILIMKKYLLFAALQALSMNLWAAKVDVSQAQNVAEAFIECRLGNNVAIKSVKLVNDYCYIVNVAPKGWVIVSADDVVTPILGYSLKGSLDANHIPDNMSNMLHEYAEQIDYVKTVVSTRHDSWDKQDFVTSRAGNVIEPLIKVHWNQDAPFNVYCPQKKALVGCVAVAMSQAMSVQRHPARPVGYVSYGSANYGGMSINFDEQRAYNWDDIMSGNNNYDEAARLMYHAGMSVKMDYGEDGSGIPSNQVSRISNALKDNFSYTDDVTYVWRDQYGGDWTKLLINELNAGRAVIYNALDSKGGYGHSFNIDGYDGERYFNVNWGWGGYGDGYFSVENLRDSRMGMNYDTGHVVIVGIGAPDQPLKSIALSHNRIEENLPAGSVVGSIEVNGEVIKSTYKVSVHGIYQSNIGGYADVPFVVENGLLKTTQSLTTAGKTWNIEISVSDSESGAELTQGFNVIVDAWASLEEKTKLSYDRSSKMFKIVTKHNVSYNIYGANGNLIQGGELSPLPELEFSGTILPAGKNTIELRCNDEIKKLNIVTK